MNYSNNLNKPDVIGTDPPLMVDLDWGVDEGSLQPTMITQIDIPDEEEIDLPPQDQKKADEQVEELTEAQISEVDLPEPLPTQFSTDQTESKPTVIPQVVMPEILPTEIGSQLNSGQTPDIPESQSSKDLANLYPNEIIQQQKIAKNLAQYDLNLAPDIIDEEPLTIPNTQVDASEFPTELTDIHADNIDQHETELPPVSQMLTGETAWDNVDTEQQAQIIPLSPKITNGTQIIRVDPISEPPTELTNPTLPKSDLIKQVESPISGKTIIDGGVPDLVNTDIGGEELSLPPTEISGNISDQNNTELPDLNKPNLVNQNLKIDQSVVPFTQINAELLQPNLTDVGFLPSENQTIDLPPLEDKVGKSTVINADELPQEIGNIPQVEEISLPPTQVNGNMSQLGQTQINGSVGQIGSTTRVPISSQKPGDTSIPQDVFSNTISTPLSEEDPFADVMLFTGSAQEEGWSLSADDF